MDPILPPIAGALRDNLRGWDDYDVAAYKLGISLGIFEPDDGSYDQFRDNKGVFWVSNPLGNFLHETLERLEDLGILEHDQQGHKYRWKDGVVRELLA